ncbi:MAG: hypothetical protein K0Q87_395 [Neobacillus sp.]|jgi:hypothetical protein|nr:hypothetical protein [Neobacillus sp.]
MNLNANNPANLPYFPYDPDIENGMIYHFVKKKNDYFHVPMCRYVVVSKKLVNLHEDNELLELTMHTNDPNRIKKIVIGRGDLTVKRYDVLADRGVDITDKNCRDVLAYLLMMEKDSPVEYRHEKLGWDSENEGHYIFYHHKLLGEGVPSNHTDANALAPAGTLSAWVNMVKEEVLGQTAMELILAAGFSAMFVPRLQAVSGHKALFIHMVGNSSVGKTTAEMLALSAFAHPECERLFKHWINTKNALIGSLDRNFGFPMVIDESEESNLSDFSDTIYTISQGRGKERAKPDRGVRRAGRWNCTLISSGESKLPRNNNVGLSLRLIEICDATFTRSAESSDKIKRVIHENYGHPSLEMAEYLLALPDDALFEDYDACKQQLLEKIPSNHYAARAVNALAIIILAAHYANHILDLGLNIEAIEQMLAKLDSQQKRDIGMEVLEMLYQYTVTHNNQFQDAQNNSNNPMFSTNAIGTYKSIGDDVEIAVLKSELPKILSQANFSSTEVILSSWKKSGILDCEQDRYTRTRKINNLRVPMYVVKFKQTLFMSEKSA